MQPTSFAELLVAARTARGMSQEELAGACGLSARAIGDLERGTTRRPQSATVRALAVGLDLAPDDRERFERSGRGAPLTRAGRDAAAPASGDPPVSLVGRERDLIGVVGRLRHPDVRMLTIVGPVGVGKTVLASAAVKQLVDSVVPIELGSIVDAAKDRKPCLLLLDGYDHGEAGAEAIAALLARNSAVRLLVTARAPVRLRAEHRWPLEPLGPDAALSLLVDRARTVRPGFDLSAHAAVVAASVVRRLHGNPLAIELVAVRLRAYSLSEVDAQLAAELSGVDGQPDRAGCRVVRAAVDRLPRRDAERLAVLSTLGEATAPELRRQLAARLGSADHLEATLTLLDGARLIRVTDQAGEVRLTVPAAVRDVATIAGR